MASPSSSLRSPRGLVRFLTLIFAVAAGAATVWYAQRTASRPPDAAAPPAPAPAAPAPAAVDPKPAAVDPAPAAADAEPAAAAEPPAAPEPPPGPGPDLGTPRYERSTYFSSSKSLRPFAAPPDADEAAP